MSEPDILPPTIIKPQSQCKNNFSHAKVQEAFEKEYYLQKTGDWKRIKIDAVMKILKVCCTSALRSHQSQLLSAIKSLKAQDETVVNSVYDTFRSNIQATPGLNEPFQLILLDMLKSTENDRWLFFWIAASIQKREAQKRAAASKRQVQNSGNGVRKHRGTRLDVKNLVN